MRTLRLPIAVAMLASISLPALAAPTSEQVAIDGIYAVWQVGDRLKLVKHLAACVADRHPDAAKAFVSNVTDAYAFQNDQERLVDTKCMKRYWLRDSTTSVSAGVYKPMLAQALLLKSYGNGALPPVDRVKGPNDRPTLPAVPAAEVHPFYQNMFVIDRAETRLAETSECIARSRPGQVMALARMVAGSAEERAALNDLDGSAAHCRTAEMSVVFPAFARRGSLMLELYRLVSRAEPGATQGRI